MNSSSPKPFYFDLDGTVVDSVDGISASLNYAVQVAGCSTRVSNWRPFIGPPLERMLRQALPELSDAHVSQITKAFRTHYDTVGLFETVLYPGVMQTLASLADRGHPIFIATNKPQFAAEAIVRHLELWPFISRVVGGDFIVKARDQQKPSKADRVEFLVAEHGLSGGFFVGDGLDDFEAAGRIGAKFFLATWGYGGPDVLNQHHDIEQLRTFANLLERIDLRLHHS